MNYWLMKSEPSTYSYEQLEKDKKTGWNGVRNFQASANMKAMKVGDRVFFYHSNEGLNIVGIAEVCGGTPEGVMSVAARLDTLDTSSGAQFRKLAETGCCAFGKGCDEKWSAVEQ